MDRRNFLSHGALSTAGLMISPHLKQWPAEVKKQEVSDKKPETDWMKEVKRYRKIDSHAHVSFNEGSAEAQLYFADKLGIEKLMISRPITSMSQATPDNFRKANDLVIKCMKRYPDRFTGMIFFNVTYQKESLEEIDRCVDAGMVGAGELYRQVKINDPRYYPIIEKFIGLKMVIMQHAVVGYSRVKWCPDEPQSGSSIPEDFVDIAQRYPEGIFQYAHIGGGVDWEYACKVLQHSPNVYVGLAGSNNAANMIDFAMKYIGEDRLVFGCDESFYQGVGHMFSAKLTDAQRKKIFFDNYNSILKRSGNHVD